MCCSLVWLEFAGMAGVSFMVIKNRLMFLKDNL